ncbi:hypothetical protein [Salinisphaera sp. G21_0]|uniref:hypothetical protein n=1 Tax=Salinisphaera sp. G21_0 TaxID=2821094 RepID=UPI001ADCE496|nr:hypothetical protein [Salinisphaera sp. G21_0]MBO9481936.1 hypothetical protein [Salinisphaera sp. G21_0]
MNKYTINSSTLSASANTFVNDIPEIPQSALDQYVHWNSDDQQFHYTLPSDIPFIQQVCLSGSEPEIMEPTSVSYLNPENRLTHFPVDNPEDLQPSAVLNPLSLNQTTRAQGIVDGNSPIVKHNKKELHNNPACQEKQRGFQRKRHKNDSSYTERQRLYKERQNLNRKMRYINDPDFAEHLKNYQREYQRERRKDPAFRERQRLRQRELRKDPAYSARERALNRQRYKDPAYAQRRKELSMQWYRKRRQEFNMERQRKCRQDSAYAEHERGVGWDHQKSYHILNRQKECQRLHYQHAPSYPGDEHLPSANSSAPLNAYGELTSMHLLNE